MRKIEQLRDIFIEYPESIRALIIYANTHRYFDFESFVKSMSSEHFGYDLLFVPFEKCIKNSDLLYEFFDYYNIWISVCFNGTETEEVDNVKIGTGRPTFTYRIYSPIRIIIGDTFPSRTPAKERAVGQSLMLLEQWLINNQ